MSPSNITWVAKSDGEKAEFAVHAGIDSDRKVYVARAYHEDGLIPGKLHMGNVHAHIPYGSDEIEKTDYEVLTAPPGSLSWVECEGDNIPDGAVIGGNDPNGDTYYIGRVIHEDMVTVGKVHQSHETCYISYGGKEHGYRNYEILVRNVFGKYLNV